MTLGCFGVRTSSSDTPGPGWYETQQHRSFGGVDSRRRTIGTKLPDQNKLQHDSDYIEAQSTLNVPPRRIGLRFSDPRPQLSTGPSYLPPKNEGMTKGVKIKGSRVTKWDTDTPGPGTYYPQRISRKREPQMGRRLPIKLGDEPCSPGPAAYDVPPDFARESRKHTIRQRLFIKPPEESNPGFTYNQFRKSGDDMPCYSFPKAQRLSNYANGNPGPGSYDPLFNNDHTIGPLLDPSPPIDKTEDIIVPQLLNIRAFPDQSNGITIAPKFETPGNSVWSYDPNIPGPKYQPVTPIRTRSIKISERPEERRPELTPGPGSYNVSPLNPAPKTGYSMKGCEARSDWARADVGPGPAAYHVQTPHRLPKWSIGDKTIEVEKQRRARSGFTSMCNSDDESS